MNKKAYQQPTMKVVKLQHQSMICQSITSVKSNSSVGITFGVAGGAHEAGSRGGGGEWDDEGDW